MNKSTMNKSTEFRFGWSFSDPQKQALSHMAPTEAFLFEGRVFTSVECAYQDVHMRMLDPHVAAAARDLVSKALGVDRSFMAKSLASKAGFAQLAKAIGAYPTLAAAQRAYASMQTHWWACNIHVMAQLDFIKFSTSASSRHALLGTSYAQLKESGRGRGMWVAAGGNMAGVLVQAVRDHLLVTRDDGEEASIQARAIQFADVFVAREDVRSIVHGFSR
jgi:predicted NAD-dependent protein-ADP-ribosyltransferase YbiA (DUF1768 family)